ncbi:MAG: hypothetical protein L6461_13140 [Anaerolineae bacterium]|nr:hypothetical protein [Anaerolineae bacterium]
MPKTRIFLALAALAFASLACMAAERLVFGDADEGAAVPVTESARPAPDDPQPATGQPALVPAESDCPNGDCVLACMEGLDSILTPSAANALRGKSPASEVESTILVTYTVDGDELLYPEINPDVPSRWQNLQENTEAHQNLWRYYTTLIPASERTYLNEFIVYTDGKDEELAAVSQSLTDPARWDLMVDITDAEHPQDLTFTLVHEFGHLLTLNADQVEPNLAVFENPDDPDIFYEESLSCPNYFAYEGCSNADSYLNLFIDQFWGDIYSEWEEIDIEEDEDRYYELLDEFYYSYEDQFITDYAATSPEEDIAESFSYFILTEAPSGDSIAGQKVLFFYQFPELVELREKIAIGLCSQVE